MPKTTPGSVKAGTSRMSVTYRDTRGKTWDAKVLSAGAGADELNLRLTSFGNARATLTNVPKATSMKQTNVWF